MMKGIKAVMVVLSVAGFVVSGAAQAKLVDRGGGLLYDTVLNVTWLQDANYAATRGYNADGRMTWSEAVTWADTLVYHDSVRNLDYSDWRLASNGPVNGSSWNYSFAIDGTTDAGYNITSPNSELAYMYHVNLGLKDYVSPTDVYQSSFGIFGNGTIGGQANVGLVHNLQSRVYWSGTAYAPSDAWYFNTEVGYQSLGSQGQRFNVWAVRPGDVAAAPVPEPETYGMLLAGLGLLAGVKRRRRRLGRPMARRRRHFHEHGFRE